MTSPVSIIGYIKDVIEKKSGFKGFVWEMGYPLLAQGGWSKAVILRLGGAGEAEVFTYADGSFLRTWDFTIEVYSHLDMPEECHQRLITAVGDIATAFEQYEFLNQGSASGFHQVAIVSIGPAEEEQTEEGAITALRTDIVLRIQEEITTPTLETS